MFVGPAYANETVRRDKHYSVAFAVKSQRNKVPLWILFVAVQLLDFLRGRHLSPMGLCAQRLPVKLAA